MKNYLDSIVGYAALGCLAAGDSWLLHKAGLKGVGNAAATTVSISILIGMASKLVDSKKEEETE